MCFSRSPGRYNFNSGINCRLYIPCIHCQRTYPHPLRSLTRLTPLSLKNALTQHTYSLTDSATTTRCGSSISSPSLLWSPRQLLVHWLTASARLDVPLLSRRAMQLRASSGERPLVLQLPQPYWRAIPALGRAKQLAMLLLLCLSPKFSFKCSSAK